MTTPIQSSQAVTINDEALKYRRWYYFDSNDNLVSTYLIEESDTTDYSSSVPTSYIYKDEYTGTAIGAIDTSKSFCRKARAYGS